MEQIEVNVKMNKIKQIQKTTENDIDITEK